ncbi:MAG: heme exporter protein CcmB [Desulfovibrionaceae bacterium]|nr:heme exporter protein CcmB [Desulfovibrionaceae bacterium]MBF0514931.1 heme exporter protein CcmB [Desulfovibrionaceae bacterium]
MLARAAALAAKDLRLALSGGQGVVQTVLFGLLLIFVFSLSRAPGELTPAQAASAIFWLASAFGAILIFNTLYGFEEETGARTALRLAPMPASTVWLGKALAGLALLLLCQAVFAPAAVAFLGQRPAGDAGAALGYVLAVDAGLTALGSLMGSLAGGRTARESLLTVILFPLLVPLLLSGIRLLEAAIDPTANADAAAWLGLALAFDALFSGAALILFPFLYAAEE